MSPLPLLASVPSAAWVGWSGGLSKTKYTSAELAPARNKRFPISTICFLEGVARVHQLALCFTPESDSYVCHFLAVLLPRKMLRDQAELQEAKATLKSYRHLSTREHVCFARTVHLNNKS
jgi:hypothetical protein